MANGARPNSVVPGAGIHPLRRDRNVELCPLGEAALLDDLDTPEDDERLVSWHWCLLLILVRDTFLGYCQHLHLSLYAGGAGGLDLATESRWNTRFLRGRTERMNSPAMSVQGRRRGNSVRWVLIFLAGLMLAGGLTGCSGCRHQEGEKTEEEKKKEEAEKKKKKQPDFVFRDLETLPSEDSVNRNFVKPGHMVTAWISALANHDDLRAEFETFVTDTEDRPITVADTRYHLVMSRPAVLPKGQEKYLETNYFIPVETARESSSVFLRHKLKVARSGHVVHESSQIARQMPPYQYLFAVLSRNPNAYGFLKQLESVSPAYDELLNTQTQRLFYRVILPDVSERMPLASHPFCWSTMAFLLWDGIAPSSLAPEQQTAMIDWLHWGGQLIVNGPGSLDQLEGSFLDPYLPCSAGEAVSLGHGNFEQLNQNWAIPRKGAPAALTLDVPEGASIVGIQLQPRPVGTLLESTGGLVAESRVGRGRVVVTAFPLASRSVVNWGCYDSFFNGCILRHPPRVFRADENGAVLTDWSGVNALPADARILTTTRYFTRDAGPISNQQTVDEDTPRFDWHLDGSVPHAASGLGGWNDKSGPSTLAHAALQQAAGISIPKATFVLSVLAVYLVVLVPANWAVFRLLGRVEWAWVAAPLIAVLGAIVVIRLAQLDIGFVRSRTEIDVLEAHGGYPRAHLTRYIALYSSLSSNYDLRFDDTSAMARPFPPTESPDRLWPVTFRRESGVSLSGFQIRSSSTGFVHAEQMFDLEGTIELLGEQPIDWQVRNGSQLDLHHVGVLYRDGTGNLQACYLDRLPTQTTTRLSWSPSLDQKAWLSQWNVSKTMPTDEDAPANLSPLTELAAQAMPVRVGEVRLIGWSDGFLPGLTIAPEASQAKAHGVVLVHLRQGTLPLPMPDANLVVDVRQAGPTGENPDVDLLPEALEEKDPP